MGSKKAYHLLGLSLYIAVILAINAYWINLNTPIVASDIGMHKMNALFFSRVLDGEENLFDYLFFNGPFSEHPSTIHIAPVNFYPPLNYIITALCYQCFTPSLKVATYSMQFWIIIYILALWGCAYRLWGLKAAWAAVLVGGSSNLFLSYSRIYFLDLSTTAMVTVSLYSLLRAQDFTNKTHALLFGLMLGLGLLTRKIFIFYSLPLLLWGLYQVALPLWRKPGGRSLLGLILLGFVLAGLSLVMAFMKIDFQWDLNSYGFTLLVIYILTLSLWLNFRLWERLRPEITQMAYYIKSLLLAVLIAAPWYLSACGKLERKSMWMFGLPTLRSITYYWDAFMNSFYLAPVFLLLALFFLYRDPEARTRSKLLWFSLGMCYATLCLVTDVHDRYAVPALPYFFLVVSFWFKELKFKRSLALWGTLLLLILWQLSGWFLVTAVKLPFKVITYRIPNSYFPYPSLSWLKLTPVVAAPPRTGPFPSREVIDTIYRRQKLAPTFIAYVSTDNEERSLKPIDKVNFDYWAYKLGYPYYFSQDPYSELRTIFEREQLPENRIFNGFKFILYNTDSPDKVPGFKAQLKALKNWELKLVHMFYFSGNRWLYLFEILRETEPQRRQGKYSWPLQSLRLSPPTPHAP